MTDSNFEAPMPTADHELGARLTLPAYQLADGHEEALAGTTVSTAARYILTAMQHTQDPVSREVATRAALLALPKEADPEEVHSLAESTLASLLEEGYISRVFVESVPPPKNQLTDDEGRVGEPVTVLDGSRKTGVLSELVTKALTPEPANENEVKLNPRQLVGAYILQRRGSVVTPNEVARQIPGKYTTVYITSVLNNLCRSGFLDGAGTLLRCDEGKLSYFVHVPPKDHRPEDAIRRHAHQIMLLRVVHGIIAKTEERGIEFSVLSEGVGRLFGTKVDADARLEIIQAINTLQDVAAQRGDELITETDNRPGASSAQRYCYRRPPSA